MQLRLDILQTVNVVVTPQCACLLRYVRHVAKRVTISIRFCSCGNPIQQSVVVLLQMRNEDEVVCGSEAFGFLRRQPCSRRLLCSHEEGLYARIELVNWEHDEFDRCQISLTKMSCEVRDTEPLVCFRDTSELQERM